MLFLEADTPKVAKKGVWNKKNSCPYPFDLEKRRQNGICRRKRGMKVNKVVYIPQRVVTQWKLQGVATHFNKILPILLRIVGGYTFPDAI